MNYYPYLNNNQYGYSNGYNVGQQNQMNSFQRGNPINYQQSQNMFNQSIQQNPSKIDRVNGREGAEAYFLMPNSEVLLLDTTNPIIWLKQTDSAGYGTVTGFNVIPLKENADISQNDYSALEQRITEIERILEGMSYEQPEQKQQNVQQPTASVQQQSNIGNAKPRHNAK